MPIVITQAPAREMFLRMCKKWPISPGKKVGLAYIVHASQKELAGVERSGKPFVLSAGRV